MQLIIAFVASVANTAVSWFPQQYAELFYIIKGVLALASTVMLIIHMNMIWCRISSLGQQFRYLTLLAFSILVTGASLEQVHDNTLVNYRNLGGMLVTILLVIAMLVSINEDRKQRDTRRTL